MKLGVEQVRDVGHADRVVERDTRADLAEKDPQLPDVHHGCPKCYLRGDAAFDLYPRGPQPFSQGERQPHHHAPQHKLRSFDSRTCMRNLEQEVPSLALLLPFSERFRRKNFS